MQAIEGDHVIVSFPHWWGLTYSIRPIHGDFWRTANGRRRAWSTLATARTALREQSDL